MYPSYISFYQYNYYRKINTTKLILKIIISLWNVFKKVLISSITYFLKIVLVFILLKIISILYSAIFIQFYIDKSLYNIKNSKKIIKI